MSEFEREKWVFGEAGVEKLRASHVAVFGVGGVGGACVEGLARAGVGTLSLFDADCISESNINRQLIALHSTIGQKKVTAAKNRILDIHPSAIVHANDVFYNEETADEFPLDRYDYVVDAIDTVSSKLLLIARAQSCHVPILSCMGTGNKVDPSRFRITDIEDTSVCPLARVMRTECRKRGLHRVLVLWSDESPCTPLDVQTEHGRHLPGSVSFVPPVAGYMMAGQVIRTLVHSA